MKFTFEENKLTSKKSSASMYRLGLCYYYGDGIKKDKALALKCFVEAAKAQNPDACKQLAQSYKSGDIVAKDAQKSNEYLKLFEEYSASSVVAERLKKEDFIAKEIVFKKKKTGAYELGCLYYECDDEKIKAKAFKLFLKAAEKLKSMPAMQKLAECYKAGCGCDVDKAKANYWEQKYNKWFKDKKEKSPVPVSGEMDYDEKPNIFDTPYEKFQKKTSLLCCPVCRSKISCIRAKDEGELEYERVVEYDDGTTNLIVSYDPDGVTTTQLYECEKCKATFYKFINKRIDYTPQIYKDNIKKTIYKVRYESISEMDTYAERLLDAHAGSFEQVEKIKDKD